MKHSSRNSFISILLKVIGKIRASAVIAAFFVLLVSHLLWADSLKEYIYLDGKTVAVEETGCTYGISATSVSQAAGGGSGSVNVTCSDVSCTWTTTINAEWITITGGGYGTGSGTVSYTAAANNGPARTGTITIAGKTFTVNQANGCTFSLNPTGSGTIRHQDASDSEVSDPCERAVDGRTHDADDDAVP